jgi:SPP1 family predicted phage head-tail adaptor
MNRLITIQAATSTADAYGQMVESWSDVAGLTNLWCGVISTGGREYYAAQKLNAETTAVFKIRYITGILPTHRVKYGTRYFHILNVNDKDEKDEFILLSCKEVV